MRDNPIGDGGGVKRDDEFEDDSGGDILASIRRIVSEESADPSPSARPPEMRRGFAEEPVLQRAARPVEAPAENAEPEDEREAEVPEPAAAPANGSFADADDVLVLTADLRIDAGETRASADDAEDDEEDAERSAFDEREEPSSLRLKPDPRGGDAGKSLRRAFLAEPEDDAEELPPLRLTRRTETPEPSADGERKAGDEAARRGAGRVTPLRRTSQRPVSPLRARDAGATQEHKAPLQAGGDEDDDDETLFGSGGEDLAGMTRAELEALIRETLREELSGPMGDRISANIRRLVRSEVSRVMGTDEGS